MSESMKNPISDHQRKPGMFENLKLGFGLFCFLSLAFIASLYCWLLFFRFLSWADKHLTLANLIEAVTK